MIGLLSVFLSKKFSFLLSVNIDFSLVCVQITFYIYFSLSKLAFGNSEFIKRWIMGPVSVTAFSFKLEGFFTFFILPVL